MYAANQTTKCQLRVTIEPIDRYCQVNAIYHWMSTQGNTVVFDLERSTIGAPNTFTKILENQPLNGWSGNNIHYFSAGQFGGSSTQTNNYYKYRMTYRMTAVNTSYPAAYIQDIRFFGQNVWTAPTSSDIAKNMVQYNAPYKVDMYNLKTVFPGTLQATTLVGNTATASVDGLMSASDKSKLDGIASGANKYTLPTASSSTLGGVKIGNNVSVSNGVISVPSATGSVAGVTIVYPAASCTTFSSDSGTVTPLAVQKGAKQFAITRPSSTTNKAITRYSNTTGDVQNSNIIIEDVTNTRDSSKTAQVIAIPAEGGKKMVYGYCTDQIDGTSFIGGVFDQSATSYPYNQGLAIGGTSGNLLWKGSRVLDANDLTTINTNINAKAPKASPTLTGTPTAPTAAAGTNTTQIATTAFVTTALNNKITYGTADLTAGTSTLATGAIYLVYE